MSIIEDAARLLSSKAKGKGYAVSTLATLVGISKETKAIEAAKEEDGAAAKAALKVVTERYKPALMQLEAMRAKIQERVMKEYSGTDSIEGDEGAIVFPQSWGYEIVDIAKVPKEYTMVVVNAPKLSQDIKEGLRNVKGVEIKPIRSMRVVARKEG